MTMREAPMASGANRTAALHGRAHCEDQEERADRLDDQLLTEAVRRDDSRRLAGAVPRPGPRGGWVTQVGVVTAMTQPSLQSRPPVLSANPRPVHALSRVLPMGRVQPARVWAFGPCSRAVRRRRMTTHDELSGRTPP